MQNLGASSTEIYAPTVQVNPDNLENLISFIYVYENDLKKWGALQIKQTSECQHSLKKRPKPSYSMVKRQTVTEICHLRGLFSVRTLPSHSVSPFGRSLLVDESTFWKSLCQRFGEEEQTNISTYFGKSFYSKQIHHSRFNMHRIPHLSLLQIAGKKTTCRFVPTLVQTHQAGAVFPLCIGRQGLLSLYYLHQGATRYWYIIPAEERTALDKVLKEKDTSLCLDHQQLLFDPEILNKYNIRYFRITQEPGQFVVIGAGALAQSYCTGASWSEMIDFALPSWLEYHQSQSHRTPCACNINDHQILPLIDVDLFSSETVDQYVSKHLKPVCTENALMSISTFLILVFIMNHSRLSDSSGQIDDVSPSISHSISITPCDGKKFDSRIHRLLECSFFCVSTVESPVSMSSGPHSFTERSLRIILSPLVEYYSSDEPDQPAIEKPPPIEK